MWQICSIKLLILLLFTTSIGNQISSLKIPVPKTGPIAKLKDEAKLEIICILDHVKYCEDHRPGFAFKDGCRQCHCTAKGYRCATKECEHFVPVTTNPESYCNELMKMNEMRHASASRQNNETIYGIRNTQLHDKKKSNGLENLKLIPSPKLLEYRYGSQALHLHDFLAQYPHMKPIFGPDDDREMMGFTNFNSATNRPSAAKSLPLSQHKPNEPIMEKPLEASQSQQSLIEEPVVTEDNSSDSGKPLPVIEEDVTKTAPLVHHNDVGTTENNTDAKSPSNALIIPTGIDLNNSQTHEELRLEQPLLPIELNTTNNLITSFSEKLTQYNNTGSNETNQTLEDVHSITSVDDHSEKETTFSKLSTDPHCPPPINCPLPARKYETITPVKLDKISKKISNILFEFITNLISSTYCQEPRENFKEYRRSSDGAKLLRSVRKIIRAVLKPKLYGPKIDKSTDDDTPARTRKVPTVTQTEFHSPSIEDSKHFETLPYFPSFPSDVLRSGSRLLDRQLKHPRMGHVPDEGWSDQTLYHPHSYSRFRNYPHSDRTIFKGDRMRSRTEPVEDFGKTIVEETAFDNKHNNTSHGEEKSSIIDESAAHKDSEPHETSILSNMPLIPSGNRGWVSNEIYIASRVIQVPGQTSNSPVKVNRSEYYNNKKSLIKQLSEFFKVKPATLEEAKLDVVKAHENQLLSSEQQVAQLTNELNKIKRKYETCQFYRGRLRSALQKQLKQTESSTSGGIHHNVGVLVLSSLTFFSAINVY